MLNRNNLSILRRLFLAVFLTALKPACAVGSTVLYPVPSSTGSSNVNWIQAIQERVPPLKHDLSNRWPLVLWRTVKPEQVTPQVISMLLQRGLIPSLPLENDRIVEVARIVQQAGAPVVLTAGSGARSVWPYNLSKDTESWAYKFSNSKNDFGENPVPVPTRFAGWAEASSNLRDNLRKLKKQGIEVDAAWFDYEGLPVLSDYKTALASTNGRQWLPPSTLSSETIFANYTRRLWITLLSTYIAAPLREVYPQASVTNWVSVVSLPQFPVLSWQNNPLPLVSPTLFTATNPVAYGIDTAFNKIAKLNATSGQDQVDAIYLELLLRQVSADSFARTRVAPELKSVVWVARWVRDNPSRATPMMSRVAYREALRHLWLRNVDAMEIFSPVRKGFADLAVQEVEDAAAVFDEMLKYSKILDHGEVMNYEYRLNTKSRVFWSGLRLGDTCLIRSISMSNSEHVIVTEPWPDVQVSIPARPDGNTYLIQLNRAKGTVEFIESQ